MEDKNIFNIDMDGDSGDEHKKLVDKFLTIKEEPEKNKKVLHFEKMLVKFREAEWMLNADIKELADEEIDLVAAAGSGRVGQVRCPICGEIFLDQTLGAHMSLVHNKK